jgi:outer membrane protein OmpA-like peptidoglycan-associated protein
MSINLNKDNGEKKKFNLSKTPEASVNKTEETKNSENPIESKSKKSSKGLWIAIVALVLLGGIWFLTSKSNEEVPSSDSGNNQESLSAVSNTSSATSPTADATAPMVADSSTPATTSAATPSETPSSENVPVANASNVSDNSKTPMNTESTAPIATTKSSESNSVVKPTSVAKPKENTHTNFAAGSTSFGKLSKSLEKEILNFVAKNPNSKVTINGYASSEGDLTVNQELSQKRAEKVRDYLIKKGVPESQLQAVGKGIENPIGDNNSPEGRMQNRRTEIVF